MTKLNELFISLEKRNAPKRGPTSSYAWNDIFDEIITDLGNIQTEWNDHILPVFNGLPDGTDDTSIDAYINGLDGKNVYVDATVVSTSPILTYFNSTKLRPSTIKEALDDLYTKIETEIDTINTRIDTASLGLTTVQKERIGSNIFDSGTISSSSSLDGKSENNRLNLLQLAKDLYDQSLASLDNDGAANLSYSVADMVGQLLLIHGGTWNTDPSGINHSGVASTSLQADIGPSLSQSDTYVGTPSTTTDDLNQLRTAIKRLAGTATWTTALTSLYTGGADSLQDLFVSTSGTGTKTSTNPWGYNYSDIDGLITKLETIRDFIGQDSISDATPTYSGDHFITDGDSLETAISELDNTLYWAATPGETLSGNEFRRLESGFSGNNLVVTHNKGSYPLVQLVQIDPTVTTSGQYAYTVEHTSDNDFTVTLAGGVIIPSGLIIAIW